MKKLVFMVLIAAIAAFIVLPCFGQDDTGYTTEYIDAMQKQGPERINALKAYVKKYPDKGSSFTRLAYYWLALSYFDAKNYGEAVNRGLERLGMGNFGQGEETRLNLVLANSYGVTGSPVFNKEKALQYSNKAIALAKKDNDKDALAAAQNLKSKLSGPPPKKVSPEQKIKMHYSMEEYSEAISYYKTLGAADKGNIEIHKTYANALLKANQLDSALKEFQGLYSKDKQAIYARRIGEVYSAKGKRDKTMIDTAINYYLEAGWLYQKQGDNSKMKAAFDLAQYQLFEKYDFNDKVKALENERRKSQASAQKNEELVRAKERELRKLQRTIRKDYEAMDMAPPPYMQQQVEKLEKDIQALNSGVSADTSDKAGKLSEERSRILKEFEDLKAAAKKRLG